MLFFVKTKYFCYSARNSESMQRMIRIVLGSRKTSPCTLNLCITYVDRNSYKYLIIPPMKLVFIGQ